MATSGQTKSSGYVALDDVPITPPPCPPPPYEEQNGSNATQQPTQQQPNITIALPPQTASEHTSTPRRNERYNRKGGLITGALQICTGGLILLCGVVLAVVAPDHQVEWIKDFIFGPLFIITGLIGVVSLVNGKTRVIIAYMVMCIISAIVCLFPIFGGFANTSDAHWKYCDDCRYKEVNMHIIMAFGSISGVCGLVELLAAITGSVYCCTGTCSCCSTATQTAIVMYTPAVSAADDPPPYHYNTPPQYSASPQGHNGGQNPARN